jgi:hypothetical protein
MVKETERKTVAILVAALFVCFFGQDGAVNAADCQAAHKEWLFRYLERAGMELDCYFTIEEVGEHEGKGMNCLINKDDEPAASIDQLLTKLNGQLAGVHVYRSAENPAVIHLVDVQLEKEKEYTLTKHVSISYKGSMQGLVDKLHSSYFDGLKSQDAFLTAGLFSARDYQTQTVFSAHDLPVRRVLSDFVPLSRCWRFLWIADSRLDSGKVETKIYYEWRGEDQPLYIVRPKGEKKSGDVDYESGAPLVNGVIPFDYGAIAYRNNPDPDKEKVRINLVYQATTFIDERLHADKPLQVRWAMFYLGKRKAKEGVPVLLKHLDYRYTTCGILEESYPAVRALTQIGKPAADAAFDDLVGKGQSDLRVHLLTAVVRAVDGEKPARDRLEKALAGAECGAQKQRLQLALKWLKDEKE